MNSDFRDFEEELTLKTGPWVTAAAGAVFKLFSLEPWCTFWGLHRGGGPPAVPTTTSKSTQTAALLVNKSFWETRLKKGSIAFIFHCQDSCSKALALV